MLITSGEDGARIRFYADLPELIAAQDGSLPIQWLSVDEAREDPNYWPEGAAFLAGVSPMRLEPKETVTSWQLASLT